MKRPSQPKKRSDRHVPSPALSARPNSQTQTPFFSFERLSESYWGKCGRDDRAAFADQLRLLGKLTWQQIQQAPRHGLGYEKIARDAIRDENGKRGVLEDVEFLAFRFSGMKSMVGYREERVFHVIWVDSRFELYDHG